MSASEGAKLIFGTASFHYPNNKWSETDDHVREGFHLLKEHGVLNLDSAQAYDGSEEHLGRLKAGKEWGMTIDTKWRAGWSQEEGANSKGEILASAKSSLEKLDVTKVDVFYLHAPIYNVPVEETLSGVDAAYRTGAFERFGLSNYPAADVQKVYDTCKANGFVLPTVYQGSYSAITRNQEETLIPLLRKLGISFYAYSPIAGGFLAKSRLQIEQGESRFSKNQMFGLYHKMFVNEANMTALQKWSDIAAKEGISTAELAYRWVTFNSALKREFGDAVVFGANSPDQLKTTLGFFKKGPLSDITEEKIDKVWGIVKDVAYTDNYEAVMN